MGFIRSRFGVVIWCVIALLVLIVPLWRLRATRQWNNPVFKDAWSSPFYGLTPQLSQEAARQLPDDVTAQLANLRGLGWVGVTSQRGFDNPEFARAEREYFARYDALERKFPNANAVRAQRLIDGTRGPLDIDETPYPKEMNYTPPPQKNWLSEAQLQAAVASARRAENIEPDNAFFPWMEAVFDFALKRDDAAIDALRRAGNCARYDDYIPAKVEDRIALLRRLRVTGWEDEATELWGTLLPHFARMRTVARAVTGRVRLARARGDEARALQLVGILQRAGAVIGRTDSNFTITKLVGQAICAIAWSVAVEDLPDRPKLEDFRAKYQSTVPVADMEEYRSRGRQASIQYRRALIERFARYMRAQGRDDLAREALKIFDEVNSTTVINSEELFASDPLRERVQRLRRFYWIGAMTLRLALVGAALWLALWPLARFKVRRALDVPARRATLVAALFSAGATAVLLAVISRAPSILSPSNDHLLDSGPPDPLTAWNDNLLWITLALWVVPFLVAQVLSPFPLRWVAASERVPRRAVVAGWCGLWALSAGSPWIGIARGGAAISNALMMLSVLTLVTAAVAASPMIWEWASARGRLALLVASALACSVLAVISFNSAPVTTPLPPLLFALAATLWAGAVPFMWRRLARRERVVAPELEPSATVRAPANRADASRAVKVLAVVGVAVGLIGVTTGLDQPNNSALVGVGGFLIALMGLALAVASGFVLMRARGDKTLARFCFFGALCALALFVSSILADSFLARETGLAFLTLIFGGLVLGRDWWKKNLASFANLAARTRIAAGALALLSAVAYFGLALWTIPVEHQARAMMQRQLQIGEVAWLREQMKNR